MKISLMSLVLVLVSSAAFAKKEVSQVENTRENVSPARIQKLIHLFSAKKDTSPDLRVTLAVEDTGGSTDVSPTLKMWLNLYIKGEMFSTDASFDVGPALEFYSAKRTGQGTYQIKSLNYTDEGMVDVTTTIEANPAIQSMKAVRCEEFDCDASNNFKATVTVTTETKVRR
jgi:hypothetical protein